MKIKGINRHGETIDIDDSEIIPDQCGVRVSAFLMDADDVQREIANSRVRIVDSAGRPAGNRPGFLLDNSNNETQARIAYDAMIARSQSAWRGPSTPQAISDATTPEAAYAARKAWLQDAWRIPPATAISDNVTWQRGPWRSPSERTQDELEAEREKAYQERNAKMQNAWKTTTKGVGFGPGSFGG